MPGIRLEEEKKRMVLVVETRDSAGRTRDVAASMDNDSNDNPPGNAHCQRPPKLRQEDMAWAQEAAIGNAEYPRCLYHRALLYAKGPDGKPDFTSEPKYIGDVVNPNFPLAQNAAERTGARGDWEKNGSEIHLVARHPYKTRLVPEGWTPDDPMIDVEACKKEEEKLAKQGWKRTIQELDLPKALSVEEISN